uniref:NUDIX domain-containing protein n=1 Tax=Stappia sp. TaxID=1870903 RepID=UPI003BA875CE
MKPGLKVVAFARRIAMALTFHRRAVTLGVRIAVFDANGHVLLVRHRYMPGWYLPGGAVDPGESAPEAALRELSEEAGLAGTQPPRLVGLYRNLREGGRDHVAFYRLDRFEAQPNALAPNREIAEAGFFAFGSLPEGTTPATLRRLTELSDGTPPPADW